MGSSNVANFRSFQIFKVDGVPLLASWPFRFFLFFDKQVSRVDGVWGSKHFKSCPTMWHLILNKQVNCGGWFFFCSFVVVASQPGNGTKYYPFWRDRRAEIITMTIWSFRSTSISTKLPGACVPDGEPNIDSCRGNGLWFSFEAPKLTKAEHCSCSAFVRSVLCLYLCNGSCAVVRGWVRLCLLSFSLTFTLGGQTLDVGAFELFLHVAKKWIHMPHGALYLAVMVNVVARGEHEPNPTGYASAAGVVGGAFAILCQTLQFSSSVTVWREGCTPLLAPNQGIRSSSLLLRQRSRDKTLSRWILPSRHRPQSDSRS